MYSNVVMKLMMGKHYEYGSAIYLMEQFSKCYPEKIKNKKAMKEYADVELLGVTYRLETGDRDLIQRCMKEFRENEGWRGTYVDPVEWYLFTVFIGNMYGKVEGEDVEICV